MELTKDDLMKDCEDCDGTGEKSAQPAAQPNVTFGVRRVDMGSRERCDICRGTGRVLTKTGEAIEELVKLLKRRNSI